MILTQCHTGNVPHQITTKHTLQPLDLLDLLTYCLHHPCHRLPFSNSTLLSHPSRLPVPTISTSLPHLCAIESLQPCFDRMRIRVMTLGTKETYPFRDPRRPSVPRSPCGCLVSTTLPQKRNSQQYALRLHPATCTMEVQNFACRVRPPFGLSSHQIG